METESKKRSRRRERKKESKKERKKKKQKKKKKMKKKKNEILIKSKPSSIHHSLARYTEKQEKSI